ncbi:MAG: hypothetical protein M1840_005568 [Geoglossum simile]|nr:MAG: hypothetical protein M1840_005568 [Geoglossum simile]
MPNLPTVTISWLKKNLWDKLDKPQQYDPESVLRNVRSLLEGKEKKDLSPPSLPAGSLQFDEVVKMFRLKANLDESENTWGLAANELCDVPSGLSTILNELSYVTGDSHKNEAFARCQVNATLISCIAAERRFAEEIAGKPVGLSFASGQPPSMMDLERPVTPTEAKPVQLQFETPLKFLVEYKGQKRLLTGFADYSLWYDEEDMGTNLVVVEAKRHGNAGSALAQCLAYMAIVHETRKKAHKRHKVVYGVCTDGLQYQFLRIDNNSAVTASQPFVWGLGPSGNKTIVSYIRYIVRAAINSTPTTSPAKQGAQMEAYLEAYDSSSAFDYGFRCLKLDEDEGDEELLNLPDIE